MSRSRASAVDAAVRGREIGSGSARRLARLKPRADCAPVAALRVEAAPPRRRRRAASLHRLLALADALASGVATLAGSLIAGLPADAALTVSGICAVSLPAIAFACGLYAADDLRSWATGVPEAGRLLFAVVALSWPLHAAASAVGAASPAQVALIGTALAGILVAAGRAGARGIVHRAEHLLERTAIVGSGVVAVQLVANLRRHRAVGLVPVGIVDDSVHDPELADLEHLGTLDELPAILRLHAIDRVIIAFTRGGHEELLRGIRACRDGGVPVHVVPRLFEFLDGTRALDHIGGMPILSLGVPRLTTTSRAAKRTLDMVLSALALGAIAPVLAVIAIAIKLESPGPVLFRQPRGGRGETVFELLKFRSMYAGADEDKVELIAFNEHGDGVMFKIRRDPRVTRVGAVLRRLSLDELPQLWNVLRGQMSLVGPRPLILDETASLEDWHVRRRDLRPGLTGPWQVYGRSDIPFQDMVRFDYQYVAGWSLARDLEIVLATIPAVVSGRGAY